MQSVDRELLSGNEAIAWAAKAAQVALGTGYPGTPSTEILESFAAIGGRAQWAPNEKVAFEVALGAAFAGANALVTMKHVGVNVAADPLFTAAYSGVSGALVLVSADDPGMSSSQNEQDNRRYATAAAIPMLEPADAQEAHDMTLAAFEISRRWKLPVMLRVTTRVCHAKSLVQTRAAAASAPITPHFERDIAGRVMIPAHARPAHRRLRQKLAEIAAWNETSALNPIVPPLSREGSACPPEGSACPPGGSACPTEPTLGIITSGVSYLHVREAAPQATILKLGLTHPLPIKRIREFAARFERVQVIEEGDPYLVEALRTAGIAVEGKPEMYRFGELTVGRVRRILAGDVSPEVIPPKGRPPQLCPGCPYHTVFAILRKLDLIVSGDIGCYTLGATPPYQAMDAQTCMGASIGTGLGLRRVLPGNEARRVISVIGDSTFMHSGLTGLAEMVYNPPSTGHLLLILDNGTTAMTGRQEHPGTGRTLDHQPAGHVIIEDVARAMGIRHTYVVDPVAESEQFEQLLTDRLAGNELAVIVARRTCILAAPHIRQYEQANKHQCPSKVTAAAGSATAND